MEVTRAPLRVRERVKLLAWEDTALDRMVLVSLVFAEDTPDLTALARHLDLGDLADAVRKAHEKLPPSRVVAEAGPEEEEESEEGSGAALSFEIPEELFDKRYVFPEILDKTVRGGLFSSENLSPLKPLLAGRGDGKPFAKMGLLGRAANEENSGTSESPFFYVTLLVLLRLLSEQAYAQLLTESRVADTYDTLRSLLGTWTGGMTANIRHQAQVDRVMQSPLAPYALRRQPDRIALEDARRQYMGIVPNEYGMTAEMAESLDGFFMAAPNMLADREAYTAADAHILEAIETCGEAYNFKTKESGTRKRVAYVVDAVAAAAVLVPLFVVVLLPWDPSKLAERLADPAVQGAALTGAAAAAGFLLLGTALSALYRAIARRSSPAWQAFLRLRRGLAGNATLRGAFARSTALQRLAALVSAVRHSRDRTTPAEIATMVAAWKNSPRRARALLKQAKSGAKVPDGDWLSEFPSLLARYRKMKADEADFRELSRLELPPLDTSESYQSRELEEMWAENASVCYGDDFATLIIGKAATAAVYFIDVTGSVEISVRRNLSNALANYSRIVSHANETGKAPLWRKEMGDGRIFCHPVHEALKRAILTVQGCDSPKVGVGIGVGFSVGEIYTDVRTGDFVNEVTNRAARLNSRTDTVNAYISARFVHHPLRVHAKYGLLYNRGVALDERALHAFGVEGISSPRIVPPFTWSFPVSGMLDGRESIGNVSFFVERLERGGAAGRLGAGPGAPGFEKALGRREGLLEFEVFCHKAEPHLAYHTPLEGDDLAHYARSRGMDSLAFLSREEETEREVEHIQIALPSGEKVSVAVKSEKVHLKGLGWTAIAEADIPRVTLSDPDVKLPEFISKM